MPSSFPGGLDTWTNKTDSVDIVYAADVNNLQDAVAQLEQGGFSTQAIAYSATITPNASLGELVTVGVLTGNITVANATNTKVGRLLIFQFTQDGTGGRTVTWGNAYNTTWQPTTTASAVSSILFWYDGSLWQVLGSGPLAGTNISVNGPTVSVVNNPTFSSTVTYQKDLKRSVQSPAFASSLTVDATAGEVVNVGALTGNITINAPTNPATGQTLHFIFTQDGTGGRTVTWNAVFKVTNWTVNTAASAKTEAIFTYDGSNWILALNPPIDYGYSGTVAAYGLNVMAPKYGVSSSKTAAQNTTAIHQARDDAGVNGVLIFPSGLGVIQHTGLSASVVGQKWVIEPGCTLQLGTAANNDSIQITPTATGVVLESFGTVDGNVGNQSGGSGGVWVRADGCYVDSITITNTYGVGLTSHGNRPRITRVNFLTCGTGVGGGTAACFIQPKDNASTVTAPLVAVCYVNQTAGNYGIEVHNNGGSSQVLRPRIKDNEVILPITAGAGLCIEVWGKTRKATITGNVTVGGLMGISADHSDFATITGNAIESPWLDGIELASTNYATVTGNPIDGNSVTANGIVGDGAAAPSYNTITGNPILNCTTHGIYFNGGNHNSITANPIQGTSPAIYIQSADYTTVNANILAGGGTANDAITFEHCTGGTAQGNDCDGFVRSAVAIYSAGVFTMDRFVIGPNILSNGTPVDYIVLGSATLGNLSRVIRGTKAPIGGVTTPGFPATTVPVTNTTNVDVMAYITNGVGALTVQVDAVTALMVIPASQVGAVLIPAGSTFTPTFGSGAPTWKWFGLN